MIDHYSAGRIQIDGIQYDEDVKIIDGSVISHWRRKKGHRIEPEDIQDILDAHPDTVVFGIGYAENVQVSEKVAPLAMSGGIRLVAEETSRAVKTYNRLSSEGRSVSGAFHLTC